MKAASSTLTRDSIFKSAFKQLETVLIRTREKARNGFIFCVRHNIEIEIAETALLPRHVGGRRLSIVWTIPLRFWKASGLINEALVSKRSDATGDGTRQRNYAGRRFGRRDGCARPG
jgi:hypothetical protein